MAEKTTKAHGVAEAVKRARAKARRVVPWSKAPKEDVGEEPKAEVEEPTATEAPAPAPAPVPAPTPAVASTKTDAPKRKRGRPRGSKNKPKPEAPKLEVKAVPPRRRVRPSKAGQPAQEVPVAVEMPAVEAPAKRRPGRPKGLKNKTQLQRAAEERAKQVARAARAGRAAAKRRGKGKGKLKAAKRAAKKLVGPRKLPTTGQSAPPIDLKLRQLNAKETDVLRQLNGQGTGVRVVCTIAGLADDCFGTFPPKQANSWVRNSLRRLIQSGLVEKVDRGKYRVSEAGRRRVTKAA